MVSLSPDPLPLTPLPGTLLVKGGDRLMHTSRSSPSFARRPCRPAALRELRRPLRSLLATEAGAAVERSPADLRDVDNYVAALEYAWNACTRASARSTHGRTERLYDEGRVSRDGLADQSGEAGTDDPLCAVRGAPSFREPCPVILPWP